MAAIAPTPTQTTEVVTTVVVNVINNYLPWHLSPLKIFIQIITSILWMISFLGIVFLALKKFKKQREEGRNSYRRLMSALGKMQEIPSTYLPSSSSASHELQEVKVVPASYYDELEMYAREMGKSYGGAAGVA